MDPPGARCRLPSAFLLSFFLSGVLAAPAFRPLGTDQGTPRGGKQRAPGAGEPELDQVEHTLRKRLTPRQSPGHNAIYVNMKTEFQAQLVRCQQLLDSGARAQNACTEVYIHGWGLAIHRDINSALQLQAGTLGSLQVAANTSQRSLLTIWNQSLMPESR